MPNEGCKLGLVRERELGLFDSERKQRYQTLTGEFESQVEEMKELDDGFAFRLNSVSVSIVRLAEWVSLERLCCAFFKFALEVEPEGGPVWLSLTGGPGVKEFVRSEISTRQDRRRGGP